MRTSSNGSDRRLLIAISVFAVLTITMSFFAHSLPRFPGDLGLTHLFQSLPSNTLLPVMKWISFAAEGWRQALIAVIVSVIAWWRLGKLRAALTIGAELSNLLVSVMKFLINRPRPAADLIQVWEIQENASFPSGHAFFAMVLLGLVAYFVYTHVRQLKVRMIGVAGLVILIILIGASRVYLGAHWPSDVLGGYGAGAVFLGIFIRLDRMISRRVPGNSAV